MYAISEIWRYRRVWRDMIKLWETECKRNGVVLQPGETLEVSIPLAEIQKKTIQQLRY